MSDTDDLKRIIARKIIAVLRECAPGDIVELRRLGEMAKQRGYNEVADSAFEIADALEGDQ